MDKEQIDDPLIFQGIGDDPQTMFASWWIRGHSSEGIRCIVRSSPL